MILAKVISGGQSGVDQAAWRAAVAVGLRTGGAMPSDFMTEDGPRPEFSEMYGTRAIAGDYRQRTRLNVRDSDGTCWLGPTGSPGHKATARAAKDYAKPFLEVPFGPGAGPLLLDWLARERIEVLNCAGSRESSQPGIGDRAELFLRAVFRRAIGV